MDVFQEEQFSSAHIGHLGLVADKIDSLNLIDLIDHRLPVSTVHGSKVSHGERIAAMILNGLGFIDSRLYLFPEFLSDKPLDRLFNRPVQAEWFNDDATGRSLDAISEYGTTKLFTELSLIIGQARNLLGKSTHIDTTTLSLYGDYNSSEDDVLSQSGAMTAQPERGYAKSGRHDLKQMVLLLATTGASNFPLWMEAHSGNASDKTTMPAAAVKIRQLCQGLADANQVDSVFLKTPERIEALMMVMTLCLMVYGVSEYELQQSLQASNETIPDAMKKPTQKPSLRWVYFLFRVVNELSVRTGDQVQKLVVNLNAILRKIIRHFGKRASEIYLNPSGAAT